MLEACLCVRMKERVNMPVSHYQENMVSNSPLISKIGNLLLERMSSVCVHLIKKEKEGELRVRVLSNILCMSVD